MRRRHAPLLLALATTAALLPACAPEPAPGASTPAPTSSETPSATPTPAAEARLVVTIDGLEFVDGADTESAGYDDAAAVLELLETATGEAPALTDLQDPPGYETNLVSYDWDGLSVVTEEGGEGASSRILVDAATVGGVPIASQEGLTIGSTRDQVIAAQGWDVWDEDDDGIADYLGVGEQEVPGTTSLTRPGETGIRYVMFSLTDDVVTKINAPADDFSDL
ncbi:hypothetical protein ACTJKH_15190 [Microbacterium sp. 22215]|uniref:hypothetical protein n=1 Tax=Microbacterium sp. 22215 TaxID=3453893 RepID=UPI003F8639AF